MKKLKDRLLPWIDMGLLPLVYPAAWLLKRVRMAGVRRLPRVRQALMRVGVFPVRDHYYEPQFRYAQPSPDFSQERSLPGIDWNIPGQLAFLARLGRAAELKDTPTRKTPERAFHFNNGSFEAGDAEYWYQIIRELKPRRIIEVGSGNSTLMAVRAIRSNRAEDPAYVCEHVCIEPYEMPWLEAAGVTVKRQRVEELDVSFFASLRENDILFIDSSHIIRPQGDVVFEFLQLLPTLNKGVVVHVHDIFSPRNYLRQWLLEDVWFWNEQYLLEAFLTHNSDWTVLGALNHLHHHHHEALRSVAPFLTPDKEPGSFYIQKIR